MDHNHLAATPDYGNTGAQSWIQTPNGYAQSPTTQSGHNAAWQNGMGASGMNGANGMGTLHQGGGMYPMMNMNPQAMANFMSSFLQQQSIKSIGSSADDDLLVKALKDADSRGQTFKQALDSLHGQNGHTATLWKDYYLDHAPRFNDLVQRPKKTAKKPVFSPTQSQSISTGPSKASAVPAKASAVPAKIKKAKSADSSVPKLTTLPGRRPTGNSFSGSFGSSVRLASKVSQKLAPKRSRADSLPPIPSCSPTPPTKVVTGTNGNRFTQEDKDFFIQCLSWELHKDPSLNRAEICAVLAEKAPHHTATSWGSYWSNHPNPADRILLEAHQRVDHNDDDDDSSDESSDDYQRTQSSPPPIPKQRPKPVVKRNDAIDQSKMGTKGQPITDADKRAVAVHIIAQDNWEMLNSGQRWKPLHEKYPQRSAASWAETYRRYRDDIDAFARQLRRTKKREPKVYDLDEEDASPATITKRIKVEAID